MKKTAIDSPSADPYRLDHSLRNAIYVLGPNGLLYDNTPNGHDAPLRFVDEDKASGYVAALNAAYHADTVLCTCCERRSTLCECDTAAQHEDLGSHGAMLAVEALLLLPKDVSGPAFGTAFPAWRRAALDAIFMPAAKEGGV